MSEELLLYQIINISFCIGGLITMFLAIKEINQILKTIKTAKVSKQWRVTRFLLYIFILGYLINIPLVFVIDINILLILQGLVYLFGAIFVFIVFSTANKTYKIIYDVAVTNDK